MNETKNIDVYPACEKAKRNDLLVSYKGQDIRFRFPCVRFEDVLVSLWYEGLHLEDVMVE